MSLLLKCFSFWGVLVHALLPALRLRPSGSCRIAALRMRSESEKARGVGLARSFVAGDNL
jgi:hypothetical protein